MQKQLKGGALLLLASFIWGMAFSAQSKASEFLKPFAFTALRSVITFGTLFIFLIFKGSLQKAKREKTLAKHVVLGSVLGVILFAAAALQQAGIGYAATTAAKSGFITALYIVIVPILSLFMGKRPTCFVWIGVLCSLVGMYLLCIKDSFALGIGDILTLACALMFALHIITIDEKAVNFDSAMLCCFQFGMAGILSVIAMALFEGFNISGLQHCLWDVLYVGVLSGGVAYTLQISGQKGINPTVASLIMCMESVFAAIGGWVILRETMGGKELFGCALMLAGSVLALLPKKTAR